MVLDAWYVNTPNQHIAIKSTWYAVRRTSMKETETEARLSAYKNDLSDVVLTNFMIKYNAVPQPHSSSSSSASIASIDILSLRMTSDHTQQ